MIKKQALALCSRAQVWREEQWEQVMGSCSMGGSSCSWDSAAATAFRCMSRADISASTRGTCSSSSAHQTMLGCLLNQDHAIPHASSAGDPVQLNDTAAPSPARAGFMCCCRA